VCKLIVNRTKPQIEHKRIPPLNVNRSTLLRIAASERCGWRLIIRAREKDTTRKDYVILSIV
jgi:hypothetical protein